MGRPSFSSGPLDAQATAAAAEAAALVRAHCSSNRSSSLPASNAAARQQRALSCAWPRGAPGPLLHGGSQQFADTRGGPGEAPLSARSVSSFSQSYTSGGCSASSSSSVGLPISGVPTVRSARAAQTAFPLSPEFATFQCASFSPPLQRSFSGAAMPSLFLASASLPRSVSSEAVFRPPPRQQQSGSPEEPTASDDAAGGRPPACQFSEGRRCLSDAEVPSHTEPPCELRDVDSAPLLLQLTSPSAQTARMQLQAILAESDALLIKPQHHRKAFVPASSLSALSLRRLRKAASPPSRPTKEEEEGEEEAFRNTEEEAFRNTQQGQVGGVRPSSAPASVTRGWPELHACKESDDGGRRVKEEVAWSLSQTWAASAAAASASDSYASPPHRQPSRRRCRVAHREAASCGRAAGRRASGSRWRPSSVSAATRRSSPAEGRSSNAWEEHRRQEEAGGLPSPPSSRGDPAFALQDYETVDGQQAGGLPRGDGMEGFVKGVQSCIGRLVRSFPAGCELHNGCGSLVVPSYWTSDGLAAPRLTSSSAHAGAGASNLIMTDRELPRHQAEGDKRGGGPPPDAASCEGPDCSSCSDSEAAGPQPLGAAGADVVFTLEGLSAEASAAAASCYYCVEDVVGRGAHGAVFRAKRLTKTVKTDSQMGAATRGKEENKDFNETQKDAQDTDEVEVEEDEVALKILDLDGALRTQCTDAAGRAQYIERVLTEASVLSQLEHENIVKFHEAFQWPPCYLVLVTEYLPGGSLRDLYKSCGPLPEGVIARVLKDILLALEYLHGFQLREDGVCKPRCIHRDVKAANILLSESGRAKLIDFGVATRFTETDVEFAGTPQWMAPEIAEIFCERQRRSRAAKLQTAEAQFSPYDCRVDVWSLGVTAYELAMGSLPWPHGLKLDQLMHMIAYGSAPRINLNEGFEKSFCYFVEKCLRKNAQERQGEFESKFCSGKRPQSQQELKEMVETFNGRRQASMLTAVARYLTFWNKKNSASSGAASVAKRRLPLERLESWGASETTSRTKESEGDVLQKSSSAQTDITQSAAKAEAKATSESEERGAADAISSDPEAMSADASGRLAPTSTATSGSQQQTEWVAASAQKPPDSLAAKEWPVISPSSASRLPAEQQQHRQSEASAEVAETASASMPLPGSGLASSKPAEGGKPPLKSPSLLHDLFSGAPLYERGPADPPQSSQSFFSFFLTAFQGAAATKRETTSTADAATAAAAAAEAAAAESRPKQPDTDAVAAARGGSRKSSNSGDRSSERAGQASPVQKAAMQQLAGVGPPLPRRFRKTRNCGIRRRSRRREAKSSLSRGADRFLGLFRRVGIMQGPPSADDSKELHSCSSEHGSEAPAEQTAEGTDEHAEAPEADTERFPQLEDLHSEQKVGSQQPAEQQQLVDSSAADFGCLLESPTLKAAAGPRAACSGGERLASEREDYPSLGSSTQPLALPQAAAPPSTVSSCGGCKHGEWGPSAEEGMQLLPRSAAFEGEAAGGEAPGSREATESVDEVPDEASSAAELSHASESDESSWLPGPNLYRRFLDGIVQFVDASGIRRQVAAAPAGPQALLASRRLSLGDCPPSSCRPGGEPAGSTSATAYNVAEPHSPGGGSGKALTDSRDRLPARAGGSSPQASWLWNLIAREQQPSHTAREPPLAAAGNRTADASGSFHPSAGLAGRPPWGHSSGAADSSHSEVYAPVGQTPTAPRRSSVHAPLQEYHTLEGTTPSCLMALNNAQLGPRQAASMLQDAGVSRGCLGEVYANSNSAPVISTAERVRFTTLAEDLEQERLRQQQMGMNGELRRAGKLERACYFSPIQNPPLTDMHALPVHHHPHDPQAMQQPVFVGVAPVQYVLPARYPPDFASPALGFQQAGVATFAHAPMPLPVGWEEGQPPVVGFPVRWQEGPPVAALPTHPMGPPAFEAQEFIVNSAAHPHPAQP
ncbi:hypothetical protein Efla_000930 [Eimeria flavescens]